MGLFDDEAERVSHREKSLRVVVSLAVIFVIVIGGFWLYDLFKPLPQTPRCAEEGYEAGIIINGRDYCYDECLDNDLGSCRSARGLL